MRLNDTWRKQFIHFRGDQCAARCCPISTPPMVPPTASTCFIRCWSPSVTPYAYRLRANAVRKYCNAVFPASATACPLLSHQRRICYKAEHSAVGTNLHFLVTNCAADASQGFAFYNDCGECATASRSSRPASAPSAGACYHLLANAFRQVLRCACQVLRRALASN